MLGKTDEEVEFGRLDKVEVDVNEVDTNEEFSYKSHRSPFPEGEKNDS